MPQICLQTKGHDHPPFRIREGVHSISGEGGKTYPGNARLKTFLCNGRLPYVSLGCIMKGKTKYKGINQNHNIIKVGYVL